MMLHNEFTKAITLLLVITQKNVKIIYYMEYCLTMQLPIIASIFFLNPVWQNNNKNSQQIRVGKRTFRNRSTVRF